MNEYAIGTHDAVTGEKSKWYCLPLVPFARTQGKTLCEQYDEGSRLFDIRVRKIGDTWYGAHGMWHTEQPVTELLTALSAHATEQVHMQVTYEGTEKEARANDFEVFASILMACYDFTFHDFCCKKPWVRISKGNAHGALTVHQKFDVIQGWRCLLPIPWIWHKIRMLRITVLEKGYNYIDFI